MIAPGGTGFPPTPGHGSPLRVFVQMGHGLGMTAAPVSKAELLETRERLFRELPSALSVKEREFLKTLVRADPDWSLIPIPHLQELPAIRWRLQNVQKVAFEQPSRHRKLCEQLDAALDRLA